MYHPEPDEPCAMTPTVSHIPVRSFTSAGCDCSTCMSDAVASMESVAGVISVRLDRLRTAFIVRYDPSVASESDLVGCVEASRLEPR